MLLRKCSKRSGGYIFGLVCLCAYLPLTAIATEDTPVYHLSGVDGHVGLRYFEDEINRGPIGQPQTHDRLTVFQEEVYLLTHSYVYHPNLLNIDFGGGVLVSQHELETPVGDKEYDEELYSLTAYLRFLEKKPYPFTLYYDRFSPSVSHSLTDRLVLQREKYGVNAKLLQPVLPFSVEIDASQETTEGRGATQIVDDKTDRVFMRAYRAIGQDGYGQLTYQNIRHESASGIQNLPIEKADTESEAVSLDTYFLLGAQNQITVNNIISYYTQDTLPARREFRLAPNVYWQHSEKTQSFYRFDYLNSEVDGIESENRNAVMGASSELTERISVAADISTAEDKTSGLRSTTNGMGGRINYKQPLTFGQFSFGAGGRYSRSERETSAAVAQRIGERVRFEGLNRVPLEFQFVVPGSVRVWNQERSQEYQEITDFNLITIGGTTYIERAGGSNIGDTEAVLVDYSYDTGGDVVFETFTQTYNANLELFKYYTLFVDYSDTDHELKQGNPTVPLNPSTQTRTGLRVDHPFRNDTLRIGGEVLHEKRDEEVSPYVSDAVEVFISNKFTTNLSLRLSERHLQRDYLNSTEDVDLVRQTARLATRPTAGSTLTLEILDEEDTGASTVRRYTRKSVIGHWRIRKLFIEVNGSTVEESYGADERTRNSIFVSLKREF